MGTITAEIRSFQIYQHFSLLTIYVNYIHLEFQWFDSIAICPYAFTQVLVDSRQVGMDMYRA